MKIYLLIMLIGSLLAAIHFTSAPETAVRDASAIASWLDRRSQPYGFASGKLPSRPISPAPFYWARLTHH